MALPNVTSFGGFAGATATSPSTVADAATLSGLADSTSFVRDFWPTLLDRYPDRQLIENGLMAHLVDVYRTCPDTSSRRWHCESPKPSRFVEPIDAARARCQARRPRTRRTCSFCPQAGRRGSKSKRWLQRIP